MERSLAWPDLKHSALRYDLEVEINDGETIEPRPTEDTLAVTDQRRRLTAKVTDAPADNSTIKVGIALHLPSVKNKPRRPLHPEHIVLTHGIRP